MTSAFEVAAVALEVVGEISVSSRQINKLAAEFGEQMAAERDARTQTYVDQPLPRKPKSAEAPIQLAAVFCDGGRMRTREAGHGRGVHEPHWRETKNAAFHRMRSDSFEEDPQPQLPECFCDRAYVEKLVHGLKNLKKEGPEECLEEQSSGQDECQQSSMESLLEWQPKTLFRTCLSSLASSEEFGPMMAAEADARGFYTAMKQAFLGDGLPYNWTIQQRWFPGFVPIADFVHVVEYAYTAAKTMHSDVPSRWAQYLDWITRCWQGRVDEVIEDVRVWQSHMEPLVEGEEVSEGDPRKVAHKTISYFTNNRLRMDYPRYRRDGLPVTSSLAESLVKQISQRVKGTEKFWNDGSPGEAILQLRAAVISDGARLHRWICERPISPFSPRCRCPSLASPA